ncbi:MAG: MFS transporter [Actinomycetia bacterium]|nr:MFS transporter [Actinomycetes bacterium]
MTASGARMPNWQKVAMVMVAGCLISLVGYGVRSSFGLFLSPMTIDQDWSRETFALALALQNLLWGVALPIAGALADRYGPRYVLAGGAAIYALGVWGMAEAESPSLLHLAGGIAVGTGVAFTAFSLALAAMVRVVSPGRRSLVLGVGTAAGSLGQVVFSPVAQGFIGAYGWHTALLLLAAITLVIIPLACALSNTVAASQGLTTDQTLRQALSEARDHRGYILLTAGFFVCGFHVAFVTVHFPAYVQDLGLAPFVGAIAISLIGLFNIIGSFASGVFGQRWSKKYGLAGIYSLRALAILLLLIFPKTELAIYVFASVMGLLWLSTVPLTVGIVEKVFGVRYLATLFGVVFLSHQIGGFLGVWLGGYLYDRIGSYDAIWWAGVAFGVAAAIVHLPINEKPLTRRAAMG